MQRGAGGWMRNKASCGGTMERGFLEVDMIFTGCGMKVVSTVTEGRWHLYSN